MVNPILSPEYDFARRLQAIENNTLALATRRNPLATDSSAASQNNFTINGTPAAVAQQSVAVPPGYSSCHVLVGVSVAAVNSTAAAGDLYVASSINGVGGPETAAATPANVLGSASAMTNCLLTGLVAGSTVTVGALVRTGSGAWASNSLNIANTSALFMFQA
jgi:hypothetical protein